ncbi:putative plus-end-directed kinesin ATPase [Helianthus annuus]|nr:putative plus-end-directed kinesin ATPase [Helianthus annuus]KAJ0777490.1 putative plus-end-directed kinesin ATPase [Helianthus annuus]
MANIRVCARFRPAILQDDGEVLHFARSDSRSFTLQDENDEHHTFSFDKVFYKDSEQADVYEFLASHLVRDVVKGINGTIITYGETGAGKTYTMEGANIMETENYKKGLLPRVVDELFEVISLCGEATAYKIKLSMVEIYMERVRDLLDLSKDNIQIEEHEEHGMLLCGSTEILISDGEEALKLLSSGIANRAVGESKTNKASSRSHCIYIFTVEKEVANEKRVSTGKLVLVDLTGSETMDADGRALEEAKTIKKSLSALENMIDALISGQENHISFRDSKITRILQATLGGSFQTALLCCCSPGLCHFPKTLCTLLFGARIKALSAFNEAMSSMKETTEKLVYTTAELLRENQRLKQIMREMYEEVMHVNKKMVVDCEEILHLIKKHQETPGQI